MTIRKEFGSFPAAHRQCRHDGHCRLIHGHNWSVVVEVSSSELDDNGFVMDVGKMDQIRDCLRGILDHTLLLSSDDPLLEDKQKVGVLKGLAAVQVVPSTSMEGLAKFLFCQISHLVPSSASVTAVTVYEDERNSATYRP